MSVKRILKTAGIVSGTFLFLLLAALLTIAVFYGERIKELFISQINKQIATEVQVNGTISFSLLSNFPKAAILFRDVQIKESLPEKNNLLLAKKISLSFSIWNLLKGNYKIEKIESEDGELYIRYNSLGNANFNFLKPSGNEAKGEFILKINDAVFKNFQIRYSDDKGNQHFSFQSNMSRLQGDFSAERFTLSLNAETVSEYITSEGSTYFPGKKIIINGKIDCDLKKRVYTLNRTAVIIEDNEFIVSGSIFPFKDGRQYNLVATAEDLHLKTILALVPENFTNRLTGINTEGIIAFNCEVNGVQSVSHNPAIIISFKLRKGILGNRKIKAAAEDISLTGTFTNGTKQSYATSKLSLKSVVATINGEKITGSFSVTDFNKPYYEFEADGKVELAKLFSFFHTDYILKSDGDIAFKDFYLKGNADQWNNAGALAKLNAGGKFELNNIRIETMDAKYEKINGSFLVEGNKISFPACTVNAGGSDLSFEGQVNNLFPFILSVMDSGKVKQKLGLAVSLRSKMFKWEDLVGDQQVENKNTTQDYSIPEIFYKVTGSVDARIAHFSFRKFTADSLHGKVTFLMKQIYFSEIMMKAEQGSVHANGKLNISSNQRSILDLTASIQSLDISQLFYEFDNFGQSMITNKHLKGKITATLSLQALWDFNKLNLNQLHALADVNIVNGELNNFEPMMALATFVKVSELKNIRFSELQNQIEIKNSQVLIPSMKIFSNVLNMQLSGTHSFANKIDYKIQLSLLKLLTEKFRKSHSQTESSEQTTEGFLNLYLTMTGDAAHPEIKYDKQTVKQKINTDLAKEKATLKETLKQEFSKQNNWQQEEKETESEIQNNIQYFEFESDSTDNEQKKFLPETTLIK